MTRADKRGVGLTRLLYEGRKYDDSNSGQFGNSSAQSIWLDRNATCHEIQIINRKYHLHSYGRKLRRYYGHISTEHLQQLRNTLQPLHANERIVNIDRAVFDKVACEGKGVRIVERFKSIVSYDKCLVSNAYDRSWWMRRYLVRKKFSC